MRTFRVRGWYYSLGECPCNGYCGDAEDCACDCECVEFGYRRCGCGRDDPEEAECDATVALDVPFGYGLPWIQNAAEQAALWECEGDDPWFSPFDPPLVEEVGEEPLDVFLRRVGATPLPGLEMVV